MWVVNGVCREGMHALGVGGGVEGHGGIYALGGGSEEDART